MTITSKRDLKEALSPVQIVTPDTWKAYKNVRTKVFIEEQKISPDDEFDEIDEQLSTVHMAITSPNSTDEIVGVCRMYTCGPYVKLGRVAVLKDHRGSGLGEILTLAALKYTKSEFPLHTFMAHSQVEKIDFYARLGLLVVSEVFVYECHIQHRTMFYPNTNENCLLITQSFPDKKCEVIGNCYDPTVMERMKRIMSSSFVPISSLVPSIKCEVGKHRRQFMHVAYAIQNEQAKLYTELFDISFQPKCLSLLDAKIGLEELVLEARKNVNCDSLLVNCDHWLSFYSAVKLCEAVLLETENKLKECLVAVNDGILMGRQGSLSDGRILSEYAERIQRKIPEVI